VIDSIQTLFTDALSAAPGSVSQVRECAALLTRQAKTRGCSVLIVGHVTKDGSIAGPRVLEHIVDTVLYFEGDTIRTSGFCGRSKTVLAQPMKLASSR
jgi:DNA repair protein RadA/Sms